MSRNRWASIAEISATPYDFVLEDFMDLLWWTMESLQKVIAISYLFIIKLRFRSILISHHIFILLQMPIASNLSSMYTLFVSHLTWFKLVSAH